MRSVICPNCGCSLVRLGVSREAATHHEHEGRELHFCCEGCLSGFLADPDHHLDRIRDIVVCPACLRIPTPTAPADAEHVPLPSVSVWMRDWQPGKRLRRRLLCRCRPVENNARPVRKQGLTGEKRGARKLTACRGRVVRRGPEGEPEQRPRAVSRGSGPRVGRVEEERIVSERRQPRGGT
jgi:hypothetical protein